MRFDLLGSAVQRADHRSTRARPRAPAWRFVTQRAIAPRRSREGAEHGPEVLGRGLLEADALARARVIEGELERVEHRAGRLDPRPGEAAHVDRLADQRVPGLAQVDADLVLPPRLQPALDERRSGEALERAHVGDGALGVAR